MKEPLMGGLWGAGEGDDAQTSGLHMCAVLQIQAPMFAQQVLY